MCVFARTEFEFTLQIFCFDRPRHNGDIRLAGSDDGTMVSRIHVADIVSVVESSIERPEPGMVMNVADDLPSTRYEVTTSMLVFMPHHIPYTYRSI